VINEDSGARSRRGVIIHYHLFKNAGTSVDAILRRNFGEHWASQEYPPRSDGEAAREFLVANPHIAALSSHTLLLPPPEIPDAEIIPVIFIRHPLDRMKSAYLFEREQRADTVGVRLARENDFPGYLRARMAIPGDRSCRNFQTHRLAMAEPADGDTELARALRAFGRLPFVGSVEAFDPSLAELERLVKPWFPEFRVFQARENVSRPPRPIEERVAALKAELGDELFEAASAANADDLELYDRALARHNAGSDAVQANAGDQVAAGKPPTGVFTPEEFQTLVRLARRAVYADWETRRSIQNHGINIVPANYYSDLPTIAELESSFEFADPQGPYRSPHVFDADRLASFLAALDQYADEFHPPHEGDPQDPTGFFWRNPAFSYSDAVAYYCVLRHLKPAHVLEVGSGFSTFIALQAIERNGSGRISCIEPFPRPWLRQLEQRATVHQQRVQEFDAGFFNSQLTDSDVLFIDSTHTVKAGSDCLHLYLRILPELTSKITVHAHDIYLPFPQPRRHAEQQIYWTEQYLLYAYLLQNPVAKVVYGSRYHHAHNRAGLEKLMRGRYPSGGGSFWFTLNQD
jgi:hypothetical protein